MPHLIPFSAEQVRSVQSGEARGLVPGLVRFLLQLATVPYYGVVALKNALFDYGVQKPKNMLVPAISVGNITTGGTGKTPLVCYLANWLQQTGYAPLLISRGYGSKPGEPNDEARELAQRLPQVPHQQAPDRIAAAQALLTTHGKLRHPVLLLDDAFQHRRIHRNLDIVVLDALNPWGFDYLLPRGLLREPVASLKRADVIALSRCDAVSEEVRAAIAKRAKSLAPDALWIEMRAVPQQVQSLDGSVRPIDAMRHRPVLAFCGIGNPQGFAHSLQQAQLEPTQIIPYPDHHPFDHSDLLHLLKQAQSQDVREIVCTHKDLVKFLPAWQDDLIRAGVRLSALVMQLEITKGKEPLEALLRAHLQVR